MRLEDEIKQTSFKNQSHKAFLNLMVTVNYLTQHQTAAFRHYRLTPPQYNVLRILRGQHPRPATVALLIDRMLDKTSNASRIVDKLEAKHLVTRTVCPTNRRAVDIRITDAGLELLHRIDDEGRADVAGTGLHHLSQEELGQLNYLLDKIRTDS